VRYLGATARSSAGGFVASWAELTEPIGVELFVRRYDAELSPIGGPIRLVDYVPQPTKRRSVRAMSVATTSGRVHVVYAYTQEPLGQIRYQAIDESTAPPGLEPAKPSGKAADRTLGKELIVSPRNARAVDPTLGCTEDGCFVAWHQPQGGGGVALIDPKTGEPRWHRALSPRATHPAVGVSPEGEARLAWVEGGRLATAALGVDGVGPASRIARVIGEQPPPAVAAGAERGEWYLTWLDFEAGQQEPYVARVRCR
jgi:serine/threonine-protein kinase